MNKQIFLLPLFAAGLYVKATNAQGATEPIGQSEIQIRISIADLLQARNFSSDTGRKLRNLPAEAIPVLAKELQEAKVRGEEESYMFLLSGKLTQFGHSITSNIRQPAIDVLIAKCVEVGGAERVRRLNYLKSINDPKIDQFIEKLATSQDAEERRAAVAFKKSRDLTLASEPTMQTGSQIKMNIAKLMKPDYSGPEMQRTLLELPKESVPLLIQSLQEAKIEEERWGYVSLLRFKLNHLGNAVPEDVRQAAITAMIGECAKTKGREVWLRLSVLLDFEDPRIDQFVDTLAASQDASQRNAAAQFKEDRRNRH